MPPKLNKVSVDYLLGSSTSGDSNLYRQAALNAPEFKIECNFSGCKRKFPTEEALQAHKRRAHTAPTSYSCPTCHSTFSSAQNRNKHVRAVHEKSKPYKCSLCGASFAFKDGLRRHKNMVHEQLRPFPCPHCPLKFKTKSHLNTHLATRHPSTLTRN